MSLILRFSRNLYLLFCLILVTTCSQFVAAQGTSHSERRLVGSVVSVNRPARTIVVQEFETGGLVNVFVPADRNVHLSERMRFANFPQSVGVDSVMPGMMVDLTVSSNTDHESTARN
jgi:hypothetical protein